MKTEFTNKHSNYVMTIAEYIEWIEQITEAKVIKIEVVDDKLTFYLEYTDPTPANLELGPCKYERECREGYRGCECPAHDRPDTMRPNETDSGYDIPF